MATKSVNVYDYLSFVDSNTTNIVAALNRAKLTGLNKKNSILKQKLLTDGYHYPWGDKNVVYLDTSGKTGDDIIVCLGVDKRDGSVMTQEVDSSFFEVVS